MNLTVADGHMEPQSFRFRAIAVNTARRSIAFLASGLVALTGSVANAQTINVTSATALADAVATANGTGGNRIISLADGTYTLSAMLNISAPNIAIISQSGYRDRVTIQGDAMSSAAKVGTLIRVAAKNFRLEGVTLQKSRYHLVQIAGEFDADAPVIRNCIMRDSYEQMLKVSNDPSTPAMTSDGGLVENCLFEYSAGIGPQYYIGGIDAHASRNWTVRHNQFRNIVSPSGSVAEFAIHFWDGSSSNIVEANSIVNCDRGIGFGLDGRGNDGGIIRNNMIYHSANKGAFADVGIALIESPNSQVYNNSIYFDDNYPSAIEYRFVSTTGTLISNNLTNRAITARDGASATIAENLTSAAADWFVNVATGDLHLVSATTPPVDAGQAIAGLTVDFDDQIRPQGAGIDIGADEIVAGGQIMPRPNPPTNLQAR